MHDTLSPLPQSKRRTRSLLWLMIACLLLLSMYQIWAAWNGIIEYGLDLQQDFIAAQRLRAGENIYTPFSHAEVAALGVQEQPTLGINANAHPPFNALLFVPLTFLSFRVAALVWTILSVVLLVITARTLIVELDLPMTGSWQVIMLLLLLNWYPVWMHLHVGQFTILLFSFVVGAWYCLRRGQDRRAGCLLAVAAIMKIFPVFLLGYALFRRRWRVLQAAVVTIFALVLLQSLINPYQWLDFFTQAAPKDAARWLAHPQNVSVVNISTRLFTGSNEVKPLFDLPGLELPFRVFLYTLVLVLFGVAIWRYRLTADLTGEFSLFISVMLLLTPLNWEHAFIFILLPLGYIWQQFQLHHKIWRRRPIYFAALSIGLSLFPSVLVMSYIEAQYFPKRMPSLVGLLYPGVFVFICCYIAVLLTLEEQKRSLSPVRPGSRDSVR